MTDAAERKEWVRVSHTPSGTLVTVTFMEGNVSVKWSVKAYTSTLKAGLAEARAGAEKALGQLQEALAVRA